MKNPEIIVIEYENNVDNYILQFISLIKNLGLVCLSVILNDKWLSFHCHFEKKGVNPLHQLFVNFWYYHYYCQSNLSKANKMVKSYSITGMLNIHSNNFKCIIFNN